MLLDLTNDIDKQISLIFSQNDIDNMTPENLDFLGMNFNFEDSDISLKAYYRHNYSLSFYENQGFKDSFVEFLGRKDMLTFFSLLRDSDNINNEIYEVKIGMRNNENMLELFSFLGGYISFFNKYKDEIMKLATMKNRVYDDHDYASFYFFSVVKDRSEIKSFKCYWDNNYTILDDDYFFDFLENAGVEKLKELIPITKTVIQNCGGHLCFEGINYNKDCSEKHKFYITDQENLIEGLKKTFPNEPFLHKKLEMIDYWLKIHPEFYCDIFAIGKDKNNNYVLNIYFKFVENDEE